MQSAPVNAPIQLLRPQWATTRTEIRFDSLLFLTSQLSTCARSHPATSLTMARPKKTFVRRRPTKHHASSDPSAISEPEWCDSDSETSATRTPTGTRQKQGKAARLKFMAKSRPLGGYSSDELEPSGSNPSKVRCVKRSSTNGLDLEAKIPTSGVVHWFDKKVRLTVLCEEHNADLLLATPENRLR